MTARLLDHRYKSRPSHLGVEPVPARALNKIEVLRNPHGLVNGGRPFYAVADLGVGINVVLDAGNRQNDPRRTQRYDVVIFQPL